MSSNDGVSFRVRNFARKFLLENFALRATSMLSIVDLRCVNVLISVPLSKLDNKFSKKKKKVSSLVENRINYY